MRWCGYHHKECPPDCFYLQLADAFREEYDEVESSGQVITLKSLAGNRISNKELRGSKLAIDCNLEELESSLSGVLEDLKRDGRRWVVILKSVAAPVRYVQVLVTQEGGLWAECVSNAFLSPEEQFRDEQLELLPLLGWQWPSPPAGPNWQFHDELLNTGSAISHLLMRTLREVFGYATNDHVEFVLFLSQKNVTLNGEH